MPVATAVVSPAAPTTLLTPKVRKASRFAAVNAAASAAGTAVAFQAPKNFTEFYEREPNYVKRWLRSPAARCPEDLREDFEQSLLLHLMTVGSALAKRGYTDRIQTYNASQMGGHNTRWAWAAYINLMLLRKYGKLIDANRRALTQGENIISLSPDQATSSRVDSMRATPELPGAVYATKEVSKFMVEPAPVTTRVLLERFETFVEAKKGTDYRQVLRAMAACDSFAEVPAMTGLSAARCSTIRRALKDLAYAYMKGRRR